jgi:hypothetical protein
MASPFRVFRKYQKTLLAIAGVFLMIAFVAGDSLMTLFGGSRNPRASEEHDASAVAVHWDGGKLTNRQVNDLVFRRRILNNFLRNVEMEGRRPSFEAQVEPPELRVQPLIGPETPQQGVEDSVVKNKLFAEVASDAGMKVSDETLLQYLDDLGRRNVSRAQMRSMLNRQQNRVSIDYVIDALREEMLARNYLNSNAFAFSTVTPEQRWKDWLRVNDRVVVEAAAVPAENYLADVKEPTEAELVAFFDKYKDREATPDFAGAVELPSAIPGFKVPRKIDLQFIEAKYDDFLKTAEAKVTDDEITKYYNDHKDMFIKADTGLMEDKGQKKDEPKTETPAKTDQTKTDEARPKTDEAAKTPEAPETKKDEAPAEKDDKKAPPAEEKKSSSRSPGSVFQLTAFQQEEKKEDEKKADAPAADAKKEESAEKSSTAPTAPPAAPAPSATPSAPAATPPLSPPANTIPAVEKATPPAEPKKPVEYQPLEQVKDQIRRQVAEGKVAEELANLTGHIQGQLDDEFNSWFNARLAAEDDKKDPPPAPKSLTDLAPIAQKNGLQHGQTGPKSLLELRELPIGKSSVMDLNISLLGALFLGGHDIDLYQPKTSVDIDGNRYVVMKTSDTPGKVPTLAEVKDEVIKAWKKEKAVELAEKHANELAKKAQDAKSPLTNFFAEDKAIKVVRTDPFAELTGGEVGFAGGQIQQQPYRISQPDGIVAVGPEFLKRVFELKDGEVAVIPNHDHTIEYIVRVVEHQPALPELRTAYLAEGNNWMGENIMSQMRRQEVARNLENDIELRANLKWNRDKDQITPGKQRDEG